jgi:NitT/TauT family transport system substrate-binding protein
VLPRAAGAQSAEVTLRVSTSPEEDMLPLVYAERNGLFRRRGLNVQIAIGTAGPAIAAGVVGGSIDVGKSSVLSLVSARARGVPFLLVAPAGDYDSRAPTTALIVAADAPMRGPRDLVGKSVAVASLRGQSQIMTQAWVDQAGADSKTIKFLELTQVAMPGAIEEHRVDAATISVPYLAEALAKGSRWLGNVGDAIAKNYVNTAYFCTADFVAANGPALSRFALTLAEAARYTNAHPAETAPLVTDFTKIPLATVQHMPRTIAGLRLTARGVQPIVDIAARYGVIAAPFDAGTMIAPRA